MAVPEVKFREGTLSDFPSVMAIGEQLYDGADYLEFHFRPLLQTQEVLMILAEVDGDLVRQNWNISVLAYAYFGNAGKRTECVREVLIIGAYFCNFTNQYQQAEIRCPADRL